MNQINVIGRIGQNPEKKQSSNNSDYYSFSVVSNTKERGEERSVWYRCMLFSFNEKFMNCIKKGSMIMVSGSLSVPSIYQDKMGVNQVSLSIMASAVNFLPASEKKEGGQSYSDKGSQEGKQSYEQASRSADRMVKAEFSDLPF